MADNVIRSDSPEALAERVATDFAALVNQTLSRQDRFSIALAGGQTPKQFYSRLARDPYPSSIPWDKIWFFWADERCVPKEHPDSNFRMAAEALLQFVPVPPAHVLRMHGEDPPPQAAQEYEKNMRQFFRDSGFWPHFDLILLGMGPDGHTASLMPGTPAVSNHVAEELEEDRRRSETDELPQPRWVVHNVIRSLQTVRLTVTYPVINQAKHIWFLVTGAKKSAVFAEVQKGPNPSWPASLVQPVEGELKWYVDKAVISQGGSMADVKIQALKNGPLLVKGAVDVLDSNGELMQSGSQVALCRCGQSNKKPLCDGTHNKAGFQSVCARQVPT